MKILFSNKVGLDGNIGAMDSKIASDERINFSDRLKSSLLSARIPTSPVRFVREFNARANGASVTQYAARKWLNGEAIPTHERIVILAHWLGVHPSWLRFGDAENGAYEREDTFDAHLSADQLRLIRDIALLPVPSQELVRDMVDSLFLRFSDYVPDHRSR